MQKDVKTDPLTISFLRERGALTFFFPYSYYTKAGDGCSITTSKMERRKNLWRIHARTVVQ